MKRAVQALAIVWTCFATAAALSAGGSSRLDVSLTPEAEAVGLPNVAGVPAPELTTTTEPPPPTTTEPPAAPVQATTAAPPQAPAPPPSGHPSDEHWFAIGRCEQPGNGHAGVQWDTHSSTYEGGLGFALSTWAQFRHADMPASAGDATWQQQIVVANDLWDRYGASPWGCKSDVP